MLNTLSNEAKILITIGIASVAILIGAVFFLSKPIPRTHDLGILLNVCINIKKDFILITEECGILAPYEFEPRYPSDSFKVNQQNLRDALKAANYIFDFVKNKIH